MASFSLGVQSIQSTFQNLLKKNWKLVRHSVWEIRPSRDFCIMTSIFSDLSLPEGN